MTPISAMTPPRFQGTVYLPNKSQMSPNLLGDVEGRFNRKVNRDTKAEIAVVFTPVITGSDETSNLVDTAEVYRWNKDTNAKEGIRSFSWEEPSGLLGLVPFANFVSRKLFLHSVLSYAKKLNNPNFPPQPGQGEQPPEEVVSHGLPGVFKLPAPDARGRSAIVRQTANEGDAGATILRYPTTS